MKTSISRRVFPAAMILSTAFIAGTSVASEAMPDAEFDARVEAKVQQIMNSPEFDQRIEKSIVSFIQKSEERRQEQQRAEALREQAAMDKLAKNVPLPNVNDHFRGNSDAEFTLVSYTDYECPFCKRFHEQSGLPFFEEHQDEVSWVYRHYPLSFHNPGALMQANAVECAAELGGSDAFWEYSDLIMERTTSGGKGFPASKLQPLAVEIGLDGAEFESCMTEMRYEDKINQQTREGSAAGVTGTPGNFLIHNPTGEVVVIKGAQPQHVIEAQFQQLKAKVQN